MTTEPQADIVERLRAGHLHSEPHISEVWRANDLFEAAAAEITRLRAELAEARLHGRREGLEAAASWLREKEGAWRWLTSNYPSIGAPHVPRVLADQVLAIDPATLMKDADHGALEPRPTIYVQFSVDGKFIRKWSFEPFEGAITYLPTYEPFWENPDGPHAA